MLLDQESLHRVESHCTQESPPRCRAACPFDLDVRAFMARMAEGRPGEARKVLERHVPLPGIMACICDHPCENVCLRRDLGGSIAIFFSVETVSVVNKKNDQKAQCQNYARIFSGSVWR